MIKELRNYFLRGLLILIPITVTVLLFWKFYEILSSLVLKHIYRVLNWMGIPLFPLLELVVLVGFIIGVGVIGGNFLGEKVVGLAHRLVNKIPLVRGIYATVQQLIETIFNKKKKKSKVALIEYPRKGIYSIGFVTAETSGDVKEAIGRETWSIFIPTTPNPTSGFLIFVPKEDVTLLDMPMEQAAKLVMSAGVIDEKK